MPITASSLCACSALPFVEETVEIDKVTYCEGALIDTVNFESLIQEHHRPGDELDEIWVSRIVDAKQVRKPKNLHDALANLCQLFAATVGEDDVKLFKYHVRCDGKKDIGGKAQSLRLRSRAHQFQMESQQPGWWARVGESRRGSSDRGAYDEHQDRPKNKDAYRKAHFINEDPANRPCGRRRNGGR